MSEKLRCIVIDDEPIGRELIVDFVKTIPFLELQSSYEDPIDALAYLQSNEVDIVFSDIEMPKINGIDLIRTLTKPPSIIFITAHRDFALEGFENGVVDYLMKPVAYSRFLKAVNRAKERIQAPASKTKTTSPENDSSPERIFIKVNGKLVKVILDDILYVEALGDYLKIVTAAENYTTLATLKSMEEILGIPKFFRVQRSFIVKITSIKSVSGNVIELNNGKTITIALNKKEELFNLLRI
ncbi:MULTISPECIES: LytR/AlgR family response regulator transcription factor [unclassified Chryseobacterium]|uniref:LytR/AlgR family response regulator transcription factor n=1 Tax=unclassified Chryseobacterium TaxID=2593645 RepID=UPI001E495AD4|nr:MULTISPECIES: LytTR family DNA-binding domain-containing protein [unclassified Chryseobacterium]MCD0480696.1 LytTR family DNA-binding domain-containing protein [Chryseobacterium sp. LC2016-29]MDY0930789.1 LytTR family DNA-binding domain-containing protein [Chryseobacterium sp. CFBP8996]